MNEITFAVVASALFASGSVFARRGLMSGSYLGGMIVSLAAGLLVTLAILPWVFDANIHPYGALLFALAGLLAPGLGRVIGFVGMSALGAARSVPIQAATYPMVATVAGWWFFDEPVGPLHWVGVLSIVAGIVVLAGGRDATMAPRRATRLFVIPIGAGLVYGLGDAIRATGLRIWNEPFAGAAIGLASALTAWLLAASTVPHLRANRTVGAGVTWFILSGISSAVAITALFAALSLGSVSVVSPIVATQPLFVVMFASIVLRESEVVDLRRWAGVGFTVLGSLAVVVSATRSS